MEICQICKKECANQQGLRAHTTLMHANIKTTGLEERLDDLIQFTQVQIEFNHSVFGILQLLKPTDNRLTALEKRCQGIENSILALTDTISKSLADIWKEMKAQSKECFDRDADLFKQLRMVDSDAMKQGEAILGVVGETQKNQTKLLEAMNTAMGNGFHELKAIYERKG